MPIPQGINPELFAALGPLMGTLTPEGALTAAQAQEQAQIDAVSQQAAEADAQAQAAQGQFQAAAGAPPPQANNFVPQLFSNAASVLGGNPDYAQGARTRGLAAQSDLMETRRQNLIAMGDLHEQKARMARELGNAELELKSRQAHDKVTKAIEEMDRLRNEEAATKKADQKRTQELHDQDTEQANKLAQIAATGAQQRMTATTKAEKNPAERAALVRQGIDPNSGFTLRPFAMREMTRRMDMAKKGDTTSKNAALNLVMDLATTRWAGEDDPEKMMDRLERMYHPHFKQTPNELRYALTGERVKKKVNGDWVIDEEARKRVGEAAREVARPWYE